MNGWDFKAPFTLSLRVLPEHIDGLEHTNNAVYVNWCEEVAWAHSESLGLDLDWDRKLTMERRFQIRRPADDATVLRARMTFACVDLERGQPRRLPEEFLAGYGPAVINSDPSRS